MQPLTNENDPLSHLVAYLFTRREAVLNNWRTRCSDDPTLTTSTRFSREEFNDQIPALLNILGQRLAGQPVTENPVDRARDHGQYRWQQGYSLDELLREIGLLQECLLNELRGYGANYPETLPNRMAEAYGQLARLHNEMVTGSVSSYGERQRTEAADRVQRLQHMLQQVNQGNQQRSEHLRSTSHDLRSSFGIIEGAASMLDLSGRTDADRTELVSMVLRNLSSMRAVLAQLTDLARLEAGQERLDVKIFDASQLLTELVDAAQPLADEKGLLLRSDGPADLKIENDPVVIQRIVQNLLMNAIRYTQAGWVFVTWAKEGAQRWVLSVQDSGPGMSSGLAAQLANRLTANTPSTSHFGPPTVPETEPAGAIMSSPITQSANASAEETLANQEGLGMTIVKRLCELLKASIEVETRAGHGTLVRIRLTTKVKP